MGCEDPFSRVVHHIVTGHDDDAVFFCKIAFFSDNFVCFSVEHLMVQKLSKIISQFPIL